MNQINELKANDNSFNDGYKYHFVKGMRGFWATKHTEDTENDRKLYVKTTIRELLVYLGFLIVLLIIVYGMTNNLTYYYTNFIVGTFLTPFSTGISVDDYWKFLSGPLMSGLYLNQWYNSVPLPNSDINYVLYANKVIGVPRLRQVRVRNNSCAIVADFQNDVKLCYGPYSTSSESTDPYGLANSTAWNYTSQIILNSRISEGSITNYNGGGYYVDLNQTQDDSLTTLGNLFKYLWIDRGTRAVILDFTVYNSDINLFCVIKLVAEFPATGGMVPFSSFRTVKLLRYVTPGDYVVLAFELLFLVFIIYYLVEEAIEIRKHKLLYFNSFWNCLDIIVIGASLLSVAFNLYRMISINNIIQQLLSNSDKYPNFENISYLQVQFDYTIAITLFFAWIKIFKYISFNSTMNQLNETLSKSASSLMGFGALFIVIFMAFTQLAYLVFGAQVDMFCSFMTAAFTLFRLFVGDFDFTQLDKSNRILGPIFFIIYVFIMCIILFTVFMAIIMSAFSEVKEELATKANEFEMTDYIKERAGIVLAKLNFKKERVIDIQHAMGMADTDGDNKIDFEEWKMELRKRGYADTDIEVVFSRYDIDGDRVLDETERNEMQIELENQKAALNNEIHQTGNVQEEPPVTKEQHSMLITRVHRLENKIKTVLSKINDVLQSVSNIERKDARKLKTLRRILETLKSDCNLNNSEQNEKLEVLVREEINKRDLKSTSRHGTDYLEKR